MSTLREILTKAGFTGAGLATAEGVATAESGGNARAHNPNAATGDNSYGLFQINMLGAMGPARRAQYGLASNEALFDPLTNAKVAFSMSRGGTSWGPWTTFTSGKYRQFMGIDKGITNTPTGPGSGAASGGAATATPAGLEIPGSVADIGKSLKTLVIGGVAIYAGAALVLLGLNKAAGNPVGKSAKFAAPVAATAAGGPAAGAAAMQL